MSSGPILESKDMNAIFKKNGKAFENLGKIWEYLEKGQVIACDYFTQLTAGIGIGLVLKFTIYV